MRGTRPGPICGETNPCWFQTPGSTGINDPVDPNNPVTIAARRGAIGMAEAGLPVLAVAGPGLPPLPKSCTHKKDPTWTHDLLWHYLHESKDPPHVSILTQTWFDCWYDSASARRHRVYELLVDEPGTKPSTEADVKASIIPWNQNNAKWGKLVSTMKDKYGNPLKKEKTCGTIVKVFFAKYMIWEESTPEWNLLKAGSSSKFDPDKVKDACSAIVEQLKKQKPVRVGLCYAHDNPKSVIRHYLGIVGCRGTDRFLCIEPWAGNRDSKDHSFEYGKGRSKQTEFLAVIKHDKGELAYEFGRNGCSAYRVLTVKAPRKVKP